MHHLVYTWEHGEKEQAEDKDMQERGEEEAEVGLRLNADIMVEH